MQAERLEKLKGSINNSPILSTQERAEWLALLDLMNDKQLLELEKILSSNQQISQSAHQLISQSVKPSATQMPKLSHIMNAPDLAHLNQDKTSANKQISPSANQLISKPVSQQPVVASQPKVQSPQVNQDKQKSGFGAKLKAMFTEKELPAGKPASQLISKSAPTFAVGEVGAPEPTLRPALRSLPGVGAKSVGANQQSVKPLPVSKIENKPAGQPVSLSASKPVSQSASQLISKSVNQQSPVASQPKVQSSAPLKSIIKSDAPVVPIPKAKPKIAPEPLIKFAEKLPQATISLPKIPPIAETKAPEVKPLVVSQPKIEPPAEIKELLQNLQKPKPAQAQAPEKSATGLSFAKISEQEKAENLAAIKENISQPPKLVSLSSSEKALIKEVSLQNLNDISAIEASILDVYDFTALVNKIRELIKQFGYHEVVFNIEKSPLYAAYIKTGQQLLAKEGSFEGLGSLAEPKSYLTRQQFEELVDLLRQIQAA